MTANWHKSYCPLLGLMWLYNGSNTDRTGMCGRGGFSEGEFSTNERTTSVDVDWTSSLQEWTSHWFDGVVRY